MLFIIVSHSLLVQDQVVDSTELNVGALVFIAMIILHFIPGGKTAGQVPLTFVLENMVKESKMASLDNEDEMDMSEKERMESKIKDSSNENEVLIEMVTMGSKQKPDDNEHMLMQEEPYDMNAFIIAPRFKSISSSRSVTTDHSLHDDLKSVHSISQVNKDEKLSDSEKYSHDMSDEDIAI